MLWTFGYLLLFRTAPVWGLPPPPPYANALQLLLTLKVLLWGRAVGPYGVSMGPCAALWGPHSSLWVSVCPCGSLWFSVDFYGSLWGPCGFL